MRKSHKLPIRWFGRPGGPSPFGRAGVTNPKIQRTVTQGLQTQQKQTILADPKWPERAKMRQNHVLDCSAATLQCLTRLPDQKVVTGGCCTNRPRAAKDLHAALAASSDSLLPIGYDPWQNEIFPVVIDSLSNQQGKITNIFLSKRKIVLTAAQGALWSSTTPQPPLAHAVTVEGMTASRGN